MVKNFSDCGFLQEGGDDFHIPATMRAVLNVDLKHALEQTRPTDTHRGRGIVEQCLSTRGSATTDNRYKRTWLTIMAI